MLFAVVPLVLLDVGLGRLFELFLFLDILFMGRLLRVSKHQTFHWKVCLVQPNVKCGLLAALILDHVFVEVLGTQILGPDYEFLAHFRVFPGPFPS